MNRINIINDINKNQMYDDIILDYYVLIMKEIDKNPQIFFKILECMDMNQDEFNDSLRGNAPFTFFEETLNLAKNLNREIEFLRNNKKTTRKRKTK